MLNTVFDAENAIRTAIEDYFNHTDKSAGESEEAVGCYEVAYEVTDEFVTRLAKDSWAAKSKLRDLFRKSHNWDESLQAIVVDRHSTHEPDKDKLDKMISDFFTDSEEYDNLLYPTQQRAGMAMGFFTEPNIHEYYSALKSFLPNYQRGEKPNKTFKKFCKALGYDVKSAEFLKKYAKIADEMTSKEITTKVFISINPAHFLTMSNPHFQDDEAKYQGRKATVVSCHSLNSDCCYKNGCTGYARDEVTFIVFTASNPDDPATLNYRKTARQLFMYKPTSGVLLQSRLYTSLSGDSYGGVNNTDSEEYITFRHLVQREIAELEGYANYWLKDKYSAYYDNKFNIKIPKGNGFGGYADWIEVGGCATICVNEEFSLAYNKECDECKPFKVGTYGLAINSAREIDDGLWDEEARLCIHCNTWHHEDDCVYNEEEGVWVCEDCIGDDFEYCDECGHYHLREDVYYVESTDRHVCEHCLESDYIWCEGSSYTYEGYYLPDDCTWVESAHGYVCNDDLEDNYTLCIDDKYYLNDDCGQFIDEYGQEQWAHVDWLEDEGYTLNEETGVYEKADDDEEGVA